MRQDYNLNPKKCEYCFKLLSFEKKRNKFCDQKCKKFYYKNKKKIFNKNKCINCGNECKNKYCSFKCQAKLNWKQTKQKIENNEHLATQSHAYKKYLLEVRGHQCEICKNIEWQGQKIPLIMDHINGNAEDNTLANLRLVCGNCDMQLPTYKAKNKGNGGHWRRKRYEDGKSY